MDCPPSSTGPKATAVPLPSHVHKGRRVSSVHPPPPRPAKTSQTARGSVLLEGPENLDAWNASLLAHLGPLQSFVTHIPEPPRRPTGRKGRAAYHLWERDRAQATRIVKDSLIRVGHVLLDAAGWRSNDPDPRTHYNAAFRAMRATGDTRRFTSGVVRDLCATKRSDFPSLAAYQTRLQQLRRQLTMLGCDPGDCFLVFVALSGLGKSRRRLADALFKEAFLGGADAGDDGGAENSVNVGASPSPAAAAADAQTEGSRAYGIVPNEGSWDRLMEAMSVRAIKEPSMPIKPKAGKQKGLKGEEEVD